MKKRKSAALRVVLFIIAVAVCAVCAVVLVLVPSSNPRTTNPTASSLSARTSSLITAGPSRSECLEPNFTDTGLAALQGALTKFDDVTDSRVTCVSLYLDSSLTWAEWVHPWVTNPALGYSAWVAEQPQHRQLVMQVNLIPNNLEDLNDPLNWEQACANGKYDTYATELGTTLVNAGLQKSVLRLGAEMNGIWESDFIGTSIVEQHLWAVCFANEVTALRRSSGERFLFDWNPNACKGDIPYQNYYPGNAYVDIVGLDLYDVGCLTPTTPLTFPELASEPFGLRSFESFAKSNRKPMSFPEWGLQPDPAGDDPGYINGIGSTFAKGDFAFECYFDADLQIRAYLPLGPRTPLSLKAFRRWFGDGL